MRPSLSRRRFLKNGTVALATIGFLRPGKAASVFDPDFGTATEAVRALRAKQISSRELVDHVFRRIQAHNDKINAFVTLNEEAARVEAAKADQLLAQGRILGPLHGLPILVKDSFETAGLRTTCGSKTLENYVPEADAAVVARLRSAGGIIVGKTNLPEFASDVQSYNEVAGTTNNPWDLSRTPGGSTGGGAAALACGFGFLEIGSDIGGSIRTPAHFCGVFGHKPTIDLVPEKGHIPPRPGQIGVPTNLAVAGPLARSAQDLQLELSVIAGPAGWNSKGYSWRMPPPRGTRLADYRIGYILDDPFCPVSSDVRKVLEETLEALRREGAQLQEGWPEGFSPGEAYADYLVLLAAVMAQAARAEQWEGLRAMSDRPGGEYARRWLKGINLSHQDWIAETARQLAWRDLWQRYFRDVDAFLMPEAFSPAYLHNHQDEFFERTVQTVDGPRQYADILAWISPATLTGCPATVVPAGKTAGGLPVGLQAMGPFLEDGTCVHLAGLISEITGGFAAPPLMQ